MKLTFPAPNIPLSLNEKHRLHWGQCVRRLDPWRAEVGWAWKLSKDKHLVQGHPCEVEITLPFTQHRRRDPHNYAPVLKAIIDALVDQGVWPDDNPAWVHTVEPVLTVGGLVVVQLTPLSHSLVPAS